MPSHGGRRTDDDSTRTRILRIRLPLDVHVRLHRLKLYTGKKMSDSVHEALVRFLAVEEQKLPPGAATTVPESADTKSLRPRRFFM